VQCGTGVGWDGLQGGCRLEVCGVGAGKISQIPAGREGADKKFQPAQDSSG